MATKKKEYSPYVVSLPSIYHDRLQGVTSLELVASTSQRGAVSRALYRKVDENIAKRNKRSITGKMMNELDRLHGDAGKFAYEIPLGIENERGEINSMDPYFRMSQEVLVAQKIEDRTSLSKADSLKRAKGYLDYFHSSRPSEQE